MCDAISHRGPDADGYLVTSGCALGMRRLSIIDVAGGGQPIFNEDGTLAVVFNGEIYNHHALRRDLAAAGHRFVTRSDTEVLVHLYEQHGVAMVSRLRGMFAFAIWDLRQQELFMARDHTGMKPLSYRVLPQGLLFGSELRSLWVADPGACEVDPAAVMQYLAFGYVPDPATIFRGVSKLPPGNWLRWNAADGVSTGRYWTPPLPDPINVDEDALVEELRLRLDAAVASHLESEVPLGAFLSGGLDSSTVVALMSRHASGRVKTFSIGFAEDAFDESAAAEVVARALNTEHTTLVVRPDVDAIFETVATTYDEPFADSSAIPTLLVSQLARQHVTVALSGDGGDELFGGYTRYQETLRRRAGFGGSLAGPIASFARLLPHLAPGRNRLLSATWPRWGQYAATLVQALRLDEGGVANPAVPLGHASIAELLGDLALLQPESDFAAAMMLVDLQGYLPGDILTKVDRATMAVSLEVRVPLLDVDLIEFALRIPGPIRVDRQQTKRLFRRAIRGIVPDSVLSRPKMGFSIPLGQWFRGPLRQRIEDLRVVSSQVAPYVHQPAVNRLVREHVVGRRDHSGLLWRLIVLDHWLAALHAGRLGRPPALPPLEAAAL
jgi:asparagine synthase (glutamine-hydrolysing)